MFPMSGSVHGPGGKLIVERLLTILNNIKRKRKETMAVIKEKGM